MGGRAYFLCELVGGIRGGVRTERSDENERTGTSSYGAGAGGGVGDVDGEDGSAFAIPGVSRRASRSAMRRVGVRRRVVHGYRGLHGDCDWCWRRDFATEWYAVDGD